MCKLDTGNSSSIQCLAQKGNNHFCFWNTKLLPMQAFCVTWFTWINSRYILEDEQPLQVENFSSQKKERDTYLYGRKIKQHLHKNIIQLSRKTSPLSMNNGLNFLFKMFKPHKCNTDSSGWTSMILVTSNTGLHKKEWDGSQVYPSAGRYITKQGLATMGREEF